MTTNLSINGHFFTANMGFKLQPQNIKAAGNFIQETAQAAKPHIVNGLKSAQKVVGYALTKGETTVNTVYNQVKTHLQAAFNKVVKTLNYAWDSVKNLDFDILCSISIFLYLSGVAIVLYQI